MDLVSPDYHELARIAKDCAAGAMIFAVLGSLGVAAAIFGPPLACVWPARPPSLDHEQEMSGEHVAGRSLHAADRSPDAGRRARPASSG